MNFLIKQFYSRNFQNGRKNCVFIEFVRYSVSYGCKVENALPFECVPAVKGLPIVGTTLDLIAAGSAPQLHKFIDRRHQQLGPIFRERLGNVDAVFVSSPALMRSVFFYEGQFPRHPLPEAWILYNEIHKCRRGLFFMDGQEWLDNRRILNKFLLNGNCSWMHSHIENATEKLIRNWSHIVDGGSDFIELHNVEAQLYRWSIDVIINLMFGDCANNKTQELEEILDMFSENVFKVFEHSSKLMNFPPKVAQLFKLKIWKDFEKNVGEVLDIGNRIVELSCSTTADGNGLFHMMRDSNMPMEDIKRIFVDLIIAAGDTTAFSTQWALYILSTNAHIQNQTRKSINESEKQSENPYVRGLLRETLRLYPVAPFVGRFLAADANLGGYKINKDILVLLSLYTSGRDENSFPNPLAVDPERWFRNKSGELKSVIHAHGTLPFAMGSRSCIGRKIALAQMQSLVQTVVSKFELICLNEKPVDITLRMVAVPNDKINFAIRAI